MLTLVVARGRHSVKQNLQGDFEDTRCTLSVDGEADLEMLLRE